MRSVKVASPPQARWDLATVGHATELEHCARLLRANAHVDRPFVPIDVDPIGATVLEDPSGKREGRYAWDEKIDGSAQPSAYRSVPAPLMGGMLVQVGRNLCRDSLRERRTAEAVGDDGPSKVARDRIDDLYGESMERIEGACFAGNIVDPVAFGDGAFPRVAAFEQLAVRDRCAARCVKVDHAHRKRCP